jgi:small-conductance mechanosensitive channel
MTAALRIFIILVLFIIFWRGANRFIPYYLKRFLSKRKRSDRESAALIKTVAPILHSTVHWVLIVITTLLVLSEMNVNIMPIIYSFSVIGLAISIGSQALVKDLINGVLTLFEGNMAVGDFIKIGEHEGYVESITLRCVHLRQKTGELRTIPFSEVNSISNFYREFNVSTVQVFVAHQADINQIEESMRLVFDLLKVDEAYKNNITGDLILTGVTQVNEYGMVVTCKFRVRPDQSKNYVSQFTKFLMIELQSRKIPFPKAI